MVQLQLSAESLAAGRSAIMLEAMQNLHRQRRTLWLLFIVLASSAPEIRGDEWMSWPSTYTHDPASGQRIDQYAWPQEPMAIQRADFQRSGYRHYRSTLQAGESADNLHIVEQWGRAIVPYEQWRFPFRPYGVPYDAWGPQAPYGIWNGDFNLRGPGGGGYGPGAGPGYGGADGAGESYRGRPTSPRGFPLSPEYQNQPWYDGTYPSAPPLDTRADEEFFYRPPLERAER